LHELQQGALASDVAAAQTGIDQAQADLTKRQADLADLVRPPDPQAIKEAELSVAAAKASYWKSQTSRDGICGGISAADARCQAANAQVGIDETTLEQVQAKLQQLQEGPKPEDVNAAKAAIAGSQTQLAGARAKLAQVQAGTLPDELAQAEAAVNQAKETIALKQHPYVDSDIAQQREVVAQADAVLALKKAPYTQSDLEGAKADLHAAQSALELAKFNLATASIIAPFDGVVSEVTFHAGEFYNGLIAAPVVALVDPLNLRLYVSVDENDVSNVQVGEDVNITFDALPGQAFAGKVIAIAPDAAVQSGVATYTASISLPNATGVKPGMTGNATIIYARRDNVLIVPNRALRTEGGSRVVSVLEGAKVTPRPVSTGVSDDKSTEILSGLRAGDQVVIPSTAPVSPQFNGGPTR
jgi:HlyD family secretion protein